MTPSPEDARPTFPVSGHLTAASVAPVWERATEVLAKNPDRAVIVDASELEYADASGIALLFRLLTSKRSDGAEVSIHNLRPKIDTILKRFDARLAQKTRATSSSAPIVESIGETVFQNVHEAALRIQFVGQAVAALAASLLRPARMRWKNILALVEAAGADALPIVALVGFLMGVIIAFEIGNVALQFGAVLYVVNGVGIGLLRELAPLMTAIVFAGRSGAAFAAEIGTQKVNDELSALTTFGLDPAAYLVVPRLIASLIAVPLLAVVADVAGLFGGALVMLRFDVSFTQFYYQLVSAAYVGDVVIGIAKAAAFGVLVAGIGCERGLATGIGAAAVGLSATRAVVASIVVVVAADGIFAVLLDRMGL
jgi:phospholipid/cholesterol/gamma-HCH transport system permease protein